MLFCGQLCYMHDVLLDIIHIRYKKNKIPVDKLTSMLKALSKEQHKKYIPNAERSAFSVLNMNKQNVEKKHVD